MMKPVEIGERLVVHGLTYEARVKDIKYLPKEGRWVIFLDWGIHGESKVYDTDENKVWFRFSKAN